MKLCIISRYFIEWMLPIETMLWNASTYFLERMGSRKAYVFLLQAMKYLKLFHWPNPFSTNLSYLSKLCKISSKFADRAESQKYWVFLKKLFIYGQISSRKVQVFLSFYAENRIAKKWSFFLRSRLNDETFKLFHRTNRFSKSYCFSKKAIRAMKLWNISKFFHRVNQFAKNLRFSKVQLKILK